MERDNSAVLRRVLQNSEMLVAQRTGDSARYAKANKHYATLVALLLPYCKTHDISEQDLINLWKQVYGDLNDAETAKDIAKTEEYLRRIANGESDVDDR